MSSDDADNSFGMKWLSFCYSVGSRGTEEGILHSSASCSKNVNRGVILPSAETELHQLLF